MLKKNTPVAQPTTKKPVIGLFKCYIKDCEQMKCGSTSKK